MLLGIGKMQPIESLLTITQATFAIAAGIGLAHTDAGARYFEKG
ncbi:hypothetical protein GCM10007922_41430 [Shewanella decolorationis]|nr:hypothetical protein GCM10007922_41430 [Shewanella decolorationis]